MKALQIFTKTARTGFRFPSLNGCFKTINRFFIFQIIRKAFTYFCFYSPYAFQAIIYAFNPRNYKICLISQIIFLCSLTGKNSYVISGKVLVCTLSIFIGSACRFLWCIDIELSFSNRLSKDERLSL